MLVFFRVRNFKSIVDATVDMRYGEGKAPSGYKKLKTIPFLEYPVDGGRELRLSPIMAIYGQNAGGKSALLEALETLRLCLKDNRLRYRPNRLHPELRETMFEISFATGGRVFTYTLCYHQDGVRREVLTTHSGELFAIDHESRRFSFAPLATESYTEDRLQAVLRTECCNSKGEQIGIFLAKIAVNYPGLNEVLSDAYQFLMLGISTSLRNDFSAQFAINYLAHGLRDASHESAFQEIAKYLRRLDIDIAGMELVRNDESAEDSGDSEYRINCYHRDGEGRTVALDFREESRGSQILFGLLGVVLCVLRRGGVLVIDEIDRSLHSVLLLTLVSMFTDREYNVKGAQLILTAHNTDLLESPNLRTSQVAIVTKTLQLGTQVRRLCDFDGVRNVRNFRKAYLEGAFSGIPFPII